MVLPATSSGQVGAETNAVDRALPAATANANAVILDNPDHC
jgi:hypothetical protein